MKKLLALSTLALALAGAGCGSDDDNGGSASDEPAAPAASGGNVTVAIKDFAFTPKDLTVKKGTKITWTNEDSTAHNVVGGDLKSKTLEQGDSYSYVADEAETIQYVCTFHSNMTATVTVTG